MGIKSFLHKICFGLILLIAIHSIHAQKSCIDYVDPMLGTGGAGHTYPGAALPFGMVQLSPDTDIRGWDYCSGYQYNDNSIMGFSHTHLSGTGNSDLGDIRMRPFTGEAKTEPGSKENPDEGYRSRFSHETEIAKPGYYEVVLDDYDIHAQLTVSPRCGFHQYQFKNANRLGILIDLEHGIFDRTSDAFIEQTNEYEVVGLRQSNGWSQNQYIYFVALFSHPIQNFQCGTREKLKNKPRIEAADAKAVLRFKIKNDEPLLIKVGISAVSIEGARKNLKKEIPHWDFKRTQHDAYQWHNWLQEFT